MPGRVRSTTPKNRKRSSTPSKKQAADASLSPARGRKSAAAAAPQVMTLHSKAAGEDGGQSRGGKYKFTPERDTWAGTYEFGGPIGAVGIMLFSHFIIYYLWICVEFYGGAMLYPGHEALKGEGLAAAFARIFRDHATPDLASFSMFIGFLLFEYALAVLLPGPIALGLPVPSENGYVHRYKCNGVYAWYIILATLATLQFTGIFPISRIQDYYGKLLTSAVIVADVASIALYVQSLRAGTAVRMTGNVIYDFFMGAPLNPKFPGGVCMKLFAEIRNSWVLLFVLGLSSAARMYEETGTITPNMIFILTCYFLYTNACQKGEECITTTWDIHHEKFGWMLVFWNTCGVGFNYSIQALHLARNANTFRYSTPTLVVMFAVLFVAYYVWDTTNSQKNRFRMERVGVDPAIVRRKTFPQLPWGYIENPRVIASDRGTLFVDGWYQYARKMHYTMDTIMATLWALSTGFSSFAPWFYPAFFLGMIIDREKRDVARSAAKYGPLWEEYIKLVPYKYLPGVW